ncbi:hypothetical protein JOC76_001577 [Neobacillus cucumis]|nr:hypothetical protein [Neobacillus cucumis]
MQNWLSYSVRNDEIVYRVAGKPSVKNLQLNTNVFKKMGGEYIFLLYPF